MEPSETSSTSENKSKELADKKAFNEFVARARAMARKKKEASGSKSAVESAESVGSAEPAEPAEEMVCCKGMVHIAYRGIADDRVYISYSRLWNEIRFFRPNGLKVFCADCRSRVL
jgi:hypothetical protein